MIMREALRERLRADAALTALVNGNRINWTTRRQASGLPAITLSTISDITDSHYEGDISLRKTRVQMDVWASTTDEAVAISELAYLAIRDPQTGNGIHFQRVFREGPDDWGNQTETDFVAWAKTELQVHWAPV